MSFKTTRYRLPAWLAFGLPLALWIYTYIDHGFSLSSGLNVYREYRLIENLTVAFLLLAIIFLVLCFKQTMSRVEKIWIAVLCLGAIYFMGEEISWGYHFMSHPPVGPWEGINEQGEPNLHNLPGIYGTVFDRLPRQLLSIGVIVGGLLGLWVDRREEWPRTSLLRRLVPGGDTWLVAVLASLVAVPEKVLNNFLVRTPQIFVLGNDAGELKECLLALFIAFYAYGLRHNLRRKD